jgi:tetratricopeptide (TPR) repeat protein
MYVARDILQRCVLAVACAASILGCAATGGSRNTVLEAAAVDFAAGQPEPLRPHFKVLYAEGEWNAVLNLNLLGHAAMKSGQFALAERAFDLALYRIESIYADDPNAKRAKSKFVEEKVKDFKGEPYERAMAYYYRGLLYLREGDFQNARAMFLSAERHDSMSESEEFQSDFGLMNYLAAWASFCDNDADRGRELLDRAYAAQGTIFHALPQAPSLLAITDVGMGPAKSTQGKYGEQLVFVPRADGTTLAAPDDEVAILVPAADINFQASTRGGRAIDFILDGKANFKQGAETASDVLIAASLATSMSALNTGDRGTAEAGGYMALASIGLGLLASVTTPAADTRYWWSLPAEVYLMADSIPEDGSSPVVAFVATKPPIEGQVPRAQSWSVTPAFQVRHGGCEVAWGSTHRVSSDDRTPITQHEKLRSERNALLRHELETAFLSSSPQ